MYGVYMIKKKVRYHLSFLSPATQRILLAHIIYNPQQMCPREREDKQK